MNDYEAVRNRNIARNKALIQNLGIKSSGDNTTFKKTAKPPASKKRKLTHPSEPTRTSARIALALTQPSYDEERELSPSSSSSTRRRPQRKRSLPATKVTASTGDSTLTTSAPNIDSLRAGWTSWETVAPAPTRENITGIFHFESHPGFTPNKSPAEMLREGAFGGSYFRPLHSSKLGITIVDDWKELPSEWIEGLNLITYLTNPTYDPDVNKYKVSCGQSIEQWEQNGWIDHTHDVRGWFQWYCRFYRGRRCDDDERQVSRWAKCVGERGRWRRALLKKYKQLGIRDVMSLGDDDDDGNDVSPVVHQTCHHWAFEVRQGVLDDFWVSEGG